MKASKNKEVFVVKNKTEPTFEKAFLNLAPRLIVEFLKLEVPKQLDEKMTEEKWFIKAFSSEVRKELKLKDKDHKKDVDNYIRWLIKYREYLYAKYK